MELSSTKLISRFGGVRDIERMAGLRSNQSGKDGCAAWYGCNYHSRDWIFAELIAQRHEPSGKSRCAGVLVTWIAGSIRVVLNRIPRTPILSRWFTGMTTNPHRARLSMKRGRKRMPRGYAPASRDWLGSPPNEIAAGLFSPIYRVSQGGHRQNNSQIMAAIRDGRDS
jgi:hypothetical protein